MYLFIVHYYIIVKSKISTAVLGVVVGLVFLLASGPVVASYLAFAYSGGHRTYGFYGHRYVHHGFVGFHGYYGHRYVHHGFVGFHGYYGHRYVHPGFVGFHG